MNRITYFTQDFIENLRENIEINLPLYQVGTFEKLYNEDCVQTTEWAMDTTIFKAINRRGKISKKDDYLVAFAVFEALKTLPDYGGVFEGIWTKLCHDELLPYCRTRWIEYNQSYKKQPVSQIEKHFFAFKRNGYRDDNSIGRLWWVAKILANTYPKIPSNSLQMVRKLKNILGVQQRRMDIIERDNFKISSNLKAILAEIEKGNLSTTAEMSEFSPKFNREISGLITSDFTESDWDEIFNSLDE